MIKRKCFMCGTDMEERTISTEAGWGKYRLTIDGIRAYVCPQCSEIIFSSEEIYMLQELGKSLANLSADEKPDLLNVSEVADLLRVSPQTVYNMIRDGRLRANKVGREWRFSRAEVEAFLKSANTVLVKPKQPEADAIGLAARGIDEITDNDRRILEKHLEEMCT